MCLILQYCMCQMLLHINNNVVAVTVISVFWFLLFCAFVSFFSYCTFSNVNDEIVLMNPQSLILFIF